MSAPTLQPRLERLTRDANNPNMAEPRTGWDVVWHPERGYLIVKRRHDGALLLDT